MSNSKPSSEKARAKNKDRKVFGFLFDKVNGLILRQQNVPAPSKGWCYLMAPFTIHLAPLGGSRFVCLFV